jgi:hypothetical protein
MNDRHPWHNQPEFVSRVPMVGEFILPSGFRRNVKVLSIVHRYDANDFTQAIVVCEG